MSETIREYCNFCSRKTKHDLLHKEKVSWHEDISDDFWIDGADHYEMLKCCGCEHVIMRHKSWFSEDIDHNGEPVVTIRHYPPRTFRRQPSWVSELIFAKGLNSFIEEFIREIYIALQNDAPRLAAMGIRALLEQIMIDKVGDQGSFKGNIDKFEKDGYISASQRQAIEPVLEAGHATIHRAFKPDGKDVGMLMDITESIIESIYINELRASGITKKIPKKK